MSENGQRALAEQAIGAEQPDAQRQAHRQRQPGIETAEVVQVELRLAQEGHREERWCERRQRRVWYRGIRGSPECSVRRTDGRRWRYPEAGSRDHGGPAGT